MLWVLAEKGTSYRQLARTLRVSEGTVCYHVRVRAPEAARPQERLLRGIIEMEKPSHGTYALVYWTSDTKES